MTKFDVVKQRGTNGAHYGIATHDIVETLERWDASYGLELRDVDHDRMLIGFRSLPDNLSRLAQEIYGICPDVIGQHSVCMDQMVELLEKEIGAVFTEDVDFEDEVLGLELLEQILRSKRTIALWWASMREVMVAR